MDKAIKQRKFEAVVMGTSAGGLDALTQILPELPKDFPLPIMVVVHLPPDKKSMFVDLLHTKCKINVSEAQDKEPLLAGHAYFAPPDYHLLVEKGKYLSLSSEEEVLFSRPSIDVLFETAADAYGDKLIGVVLTGANEDGAVGLKNIIDAGGVGLVQAPETAFIFTMPQAALYLSPNAKALTLSQITEYLQKVAA